jgi:hypothetical protein
MESNLPQLNVKFAIGTTVLYNPKRPAAQEDQHAAKRAVVTRYSRSKPGGCFIEFPTGGILRVPESDIEPVEA